MKGKLAGFAILIAALLAFAATAPAHETDQFTLPQGREFADLGPYLNTWAYRAIADGVKNVNARIIQYRSQYRGPTGLAELQSEDEIVRSINEQFGPAYDVIEGYEHLLYTDSMKQRYPGKLVAFKDQFGNIYQHVHFPLDPRQFFRLWHASTIYAYGSYLGTDKLGHFTDMGLHYYKAYREAKRKGASDAQAMHDAVQIGVEGPLFSERGMVGYLSAGDYSNADLVANYLGLLFYLNLTQPVMIKGKMQPPMLVRDGDLWKIAPHVRRDSDFFAIFISDHLDEALNPGLFESDMRDAIRTAVRERASAILNRRCDAHGNRRSRQYFDAILKDLTTYYGQDYGHDGDYNELISIGSTCFEDLPANAPVTARDFTGHTPLHQAADRGELEVVKRLVERGADVNATVRTSELFSPEWGQTPLHMAARRGRMDIVNYLLDHGANINARDDRGITPLHLALAYPDLVNAMLQKGAMLAAADDVGNTPLHWAALDGQPESLDLLVRAGSDVRARNNQGETALHLAARSGSAETAAHLIAAGADLNARSRLGMSPLHFAAANQSIAVVDLLLAKGADVQSADSFGWSPLHEAAANASAPITELLLRHGANPNAGDAHHSTALHVACRRDCDEVVEALLANAANVNAQNDFGASALHEAAKSGSTIVVSALLQHGATRSLKDMAGMTPLQIASRAGKSEIVSVLRAAADASTSRSTPVSSAGAMR